VRKTGRIVTAEEAQAAGGLGGAVAELLSFEHPTPLLRCGIEDRFGETGRPAELLDSFGLSGARLADRIGGFMGGSS